MSKSKRYQLEKKIMVFLSSGLFAISGFCAGDVYAAAIFADGTGTNSTVAGVNNNASGENTNAVGYNNHAISDNSNAIGANNQLWPRIPMPSAVKTTLMPMNRTRSAAAISLMASGLMLLVRIMWPMAWTVTLLVLPIRRIRIIPMLSVPAIWRMVSVRAPLVI